MQIQDIIAASPVHVDRILRAWLQARPLDQRTRRQSEHYYPVGCTIKAPNCSPRQQVAPTQRS
jgi:hypothetical protein